MRISRTEPVTYVRGKVNINRISLGRTGVKSTFYRPRHTWGHNHSTERKRVRFLDYFTLNFV
jgi:hypothetical protein